MRSHAVADLHHLQRRLAPLDASTWAPAEQRLLREVLVATIAALQALYPDNFNSAQRIQLLHQLSVLEEEFYTLTQARTADQWQHLHASLREAIDNTLANEAAAH